MTALPHVDHGAHCAQVPADRTAPVPSPRTGSIRDVVLTLRPSIAIAAGLDVQPHDDLTDSGLQAWRAGLASYVVEMVLLGSRSSVLRWARRDLKSEQKRWHDGTVLLQALTTAAKHGDWTSSGALDETWSANIAAHRQRLELGRAALTGSDAIEAMVLHDRLEPCASATRRELVTFANMPLINRPRQSTPPLICDAGVKLLAAIWD